MTVEPSMIMNNSGDRIDVRCKMSEVRCSNPPITVEPSMNGNNRDGVIYDV